MSDNINLRKLNAHKIDFYYLRILQSLKISCYTLLSGVYSLHYCVVRLTPVSDANQSVIQLHLLLEESQPEPTDIIYNTCRYINSLLTLIY